MLQNLVFVSCLVLVCELSAEELGSEIQRGNILLSKAFDQHKIELRTAEQFAGAINSLSFNGHEMLDDHDHGRELQSASNFDAGSPISNETYNPTEAGSVIDQNFPRSSSKLLHAVASQDELQTITQMAFWLSPEGNSNGRPAKNKTLLSNHILMKDVKLGFKEWPYVIPYEVTFRLPVDEKHTRGTFEALTGYMPDEFEVFIKFKKNNQRFEELDHVAGEQPSPLILSTKDGKYAMGCYAPQSLNKEHPEPGYGRFMFRPQKVSKWNIVYRYHDEAGLGNRSYTFKMFVLVHDLETVKKTLEQLIKEIP
jgi:hypothetical protein